MAFARVYPFRGWTKEIVAAAVSMLATITIIAVLKNADQQQQRPWVIANTQLTLNTVIAIISTVLRTSLLMMVAGALSQSPWNWLARKTTSKKSARQLRDLDTFGESASSSWASLKLLYRTRFRHLAALGALVTILSLAFDAFAQQVLTGEARPVQVLQTAANLSAEYVIPRSTSYVNMLSVLREGSAAQPGIIRLDIEYPNPPGDAIAAILSGILGTSKPSVEAVCSTTNCTWPISPTSGLCSVCDDVRDKMTSKHNTTWGFNTYTLLFDDGSSHGPNNISMSAPAGSADGEVFFALASTVSNGTARNFTRGQQNITTVWTLGVPASAGKDPSSWTESSIVAYRCDLYFCLQGYNATSTNGRFNIQPVQSWGQMDVSVPPEEADIVTTSWSPDSPQPVWTFVDVPASMNVGNASAYTMDFISRLSLSHTFSSTVVGTVNEDADSGSPLFDQSGFSGSAPNALEAAIVEMFWLSANSTETMSAKMNHIAQTFTAYMQNELTAPPDMRYAPATYSEATFVVVRWPWLAYPLGLVLIGYLFFAATVYQTHRGAVLPWEGQRLHLLFADVDNEIRNSVAGSLDQTLKERVGKMQVHLEYDKQDGLAFKRVQERPHPPPNDRDSKLLADINDE